MSYCLKSGGQQFFFAVANDLAERAIHAQPLTLQRNEGHTDRSVVKSVAKMLFCFLEGFADPLLLSDVTAALSWDLAAQVMEKLDLDLPREDEAEVWPAGDLGVFADLGLDEMELGAILSDDDAYADEMLSTLARRLGFAEPYERVVDTSLARDALKLLA